MKRTLVSVLLSMLMLGGFSAPAFAGNTTGTVSAVAQVTSVNGQNVTQYNTNLALSNDLSTKVFATADLGYDLVNVNHALELNSASGHVVTYDVGLGLKASSNVTLFANYGVQPPSYGYFSPTPKLGYSVGAAVRLF